MDNRELERTVVKKNSVVVKSIGERHSPPTRKEILTKTYPTPPTIIPVEIRGGIKVGG